MINSGILVLAANPFAAAVEPIVELANMVLGPAIAVVGALGAIWCILLGVKLAKAEEPQEREKAKGALKNAVVGYLLIFVLIVVLKVSLQPMVDWVNNAGSSSSSTGSSYNIDMNINKKSTSK